MEIWTETYSLSSIEKTIKLSNISSNKSPTFKMAIVVMLRLMKSDEHNRFARLMLVYHYHYTMSLIVTFVRSLSIRKLILAPRKINYVVVSNLDRYFTTVYMFKKPYIVLL